ncbi:MAG: tRNA (adenosine(37)-N6)-dimethylallyltransferase MiaA, partial [Clostridiales bacterium]|nr:tRNA (adenosine(37)-N6)-dimethylallyltransferase MiaA [Clostridiales bacterium]
MTKIVVICGPTACGKTPAAIHLARLIGGEIISADSMQIYRQMDIGTAKATPDEMRGVPHHLIDELAPDADYSVAIFKNRAAGLIKDIASRGKMPIICGGTGFYINALLYDTKFDTEIDSDWDYRQNLEEIAKEKGPHHLHDMLKNVDPQAAKAIDINNVKRVVRALEYFRRHNALISLHNLQQKEKRQRPAYDAQVFVLHGERAAMYDRINRRVDKMAAAGLVEEVAALLSAGYSPDLPSMQGLGYKEIVKYLQSEQPLEMAITAVKRGTRHFAKRQLTWFRNQLP